MKVVEKKIAPNSLNSTNIQYAAETLRMYALFQRFKQSVN